MENLALIRAEHERQYLYHFDSQLSPAISFSPGR